MPIRVLCVFACLDRGGAETMCMNLYRHINREIIQFDFVKHTTSKGQYEEEVQFLGGRIYTAPKYRIYNHREYCQWWRNHFKEHPEHKLIHGHFITVAAVYFSIARQFGRKTIAHIHSTKPRGNAVQKMIKSVYIHWAEKYSDLCVACSDAAGKWAFPTQKFSILKNAINTEKFRFKSKMRFVVREELGVPSDSLVVGIVGSLSKVKNPFRTIEIFKAVHDHNSSARLLWVGDGSMRKEIEKKLRDEGLTGAVIMTGVRSDVDRLMQAMDVFILPSLWEGLGMVAIEAQAAGLPCFISDTVTEEAAITDLCTFLPLGDSERWADEILNADLSGRRDTSQEIKDAGYDIKTTAKWLEEFYLNCLE